MSIRDKDIFLSYRNDGSGQNFAARLEKDLSDVGYSVYFNPNEMGASDFPERLRRAIGKCSDFIAVCSKGYLERLKPDDGTSPNWIREELLAAHAAKRKIIPILIDGAEMPQNADDVSDDLGWFCSIDAITMPNQYLATPFNDLKHSITAKPDKNDIYKHAENTNPFFQAKPEYAGIMEILKDDKTDVTEDRAETMLTAAIMNYYGLCTRRDYGETQKWLKKIPTKFKKIRANADNLLAHMYYDGQIEYENQSYEKSYEYHKKASRYNTDSLAVKSFAERFGIGCPFDYDNLIQSYAAAVGKKSDSIAHLELGNFYETYGKWQEAADQYRLITGTSYEAAYRLGLLYKKGVLTDPYKPDYVSAVGCFQPLVTGDYPHVEAAYELGMCYARPVTVDGVDNLKKDFIKAKKYFIIAADRGHIEAAYMVGFLFENGLAGPDTANTANAFKYYQIAADAGHALAAVQLAQLYQEDNEFKNYHRAYRYADIAARGGAAAGNMILGNLLLLGRGCEPDTEWAYRYYSIAAENGIFAAELMMDVIRRKQNNVSDKEEIQKAYNLFDSDDVDKVKKAYGILSKYYHTDGRAANLLGLMYHYGRGVERDDAKAVELFETAVRYGYRAAYCNLADAYFFGNGVDVDYVTAADNYKKAAEISDENGETDHDAGMNYGYMLYQGLGVPKDTALAKEYLLRAANHYIPLARYRLAVVFEEEKDYKKSFYWYTRAAECHITEAYKKLGEYYMKGLGVEKDEEKARKWFERL